MKIAFLNIHNGIVERGSEVFVDEIAAQLSSLNQVDVFQIGEKKEKKYKVIQIKGVPYIKNQTWFYGFSVLIFSFKCLPYLLKNKYDWIIPVNGGTQALFCRIVRFITHAKLLISGHAGVGRSDKINIILGKPDIFIALSRQALNWVKEQFPSQRTTYIPNGIDLNLFNVSSKPADTGLNHPIILCVSALLQYKRILLLINAVSLLPDVSLLIIGDGPLYEDIYNQASIKLPGRFKIIKKVNHLDIPGFYKTSDVFSLPSKDSEAFGLVYLEALASNIPVVAPEDENRKDIIGNAGIYTDVEDSVKYSEALKRAIIYSWNDLPRMQASKFGWSHISSRYEETVKKMI